MITENETPLSKEIEIIELPENIFIYILPKWSIEEINMIKSKYKEWSKLEHIPEIRIVLSADKQIINYLVSKYLPKLDDFNYNSKGHIPYKLRAQEYILYSLCSINNYQKNISNKRDSIDVSKFILNIESIINFLYKENFNTELELNLNPIDINLNIYNLLTNIYDLWR